MASAQGILPMPEMQASFLHPSSNAPSKEKEDAIQGNHFAVFWALLFSNPLPPTPFQRTPNPPKFAQPSLSRAKGRSSPARAYKFGCVCSYMAGVILHQRSDWPYRNKHTQICTLSLGLTALLTLLKRGCANSGGFGAR